MKKNLPTLLATIIWSLLYSQSVSADLLKQCSIGVPQYTKPLVSGDPNSLPVTIRSEKTDVNYPHQAIFNGDVIIEQGNRTLLADRADVEQTDLAGQTIPQRTLTATGNVRYSDPDIQLQGPKAWSNLNTKDTDVYDGQYQMVGRQGRGDATSLKTRNDNRYTIFDHGTFTSCLAGDNSWSIAGSEIIYDRQEEVAEIWNARFKLGPVPVFYSPYLHLPVGNKRRSGFLIPEIKYSNGMEFALPYYWNIAANYDATITPHYIDSRGLQWQNEFRYLNRPGSGVMAFDWLPNDRLYRNTSPDDDTRWLFYWNHNGVMDQVWRFNINYTKVSDPDYFSNLDSAYGSSTDGYVTQKFSLGYAQQNWNSTLSTSQFQVFARGGNQNSYRTEPQLDLNYYQNDLGPFDFRLYGQAAKFISESVSNPKTTRWHIEPTINLPLSNRWASLNSEVKLMTTQYQQNIPTLGDPVLKERVNRVLPQFKLDGKMVFERETVLIKNYTQTLEPQVQYLYVPYKDQTAIGLYDTTLLQNDYNGLFRDRTFSGLDRIASANQITSGVTSRMYDAQLDERFHVSVGQIYYFNKSRTGPSSSGTQGNFSQLGDTGSLAWAADSAWKITPQWAIRGGLQYDTRVENLTLANSVLEYRQDQDRIMQLNYRYASSEYITAMLPWQVAPLYQEGLSQVGVVGSWPVADRWALVGAHYYDTKRQQTADSKVGIQYNTCCWSIGVVYERKIDMWNDTRRMSNYDNKYSLSFQLRGLGSNRSLGNTEMLRAGILPYQRAF